MRFMLCLVVIGIAQSQPVKPYLRIETGTHGTAVRAIDVDAAERFMVSVSFDKTARVWELASGKLLKTLRPPIGDAQEGRLYAVAISPDGETVAVGGFTGPRNSFSFPIYIFDRQTGALRRATAALPETTHDLSYSKDGRFIASGLGGKNGIRIFETTRYSEVARDISYGDSCYWVEFDQLGRLVTASLDGFLRLYDSSFHLVGKVKALGGNRPVSARFSTDGSRIAVGFQDPASISIVSGADLSHRASLEPPAEEFSASVTLWSHDDLTVCAAGRYRDDWVHPIVCWENGSNRQVKTFPVAGGTIMGILALRDGAIAFCSADGSLGVLDRNGRARWRSAPDLLYYGVTPPTLDISSDGGTVEAVSYYLNGTERTRHTVSFSVPDRNLTVDTQSRRFLSAPTTSGLDVDHWRDDEHPTLNGVALALEPYEISRSLAITQAKDSFVLGTEWSIRKFDRRGQESWGTSVPGVAWKVNISGDGRFVVAALGDGTIRWYNLEKGDEVLALFVDRDLRRWVAWNPDGFFDFQNGGDALIGYQINRGREHEGEFVKVDQLREVFYQPDLIAQSLKPGGAEALLVARNRIGDISKILSRGLPPEIDLISPADATVAGDYLLQFRLRELGGGRGRIVYRIDGAEIEGRAAIDIHGTAGDTNSRYIPIADGSHTLTLAAYDAEGKIEGAPKTIRLTRTLPARGANLYVVAAGISHYSDNSLSAGVKFAAADAELVAARFLEQEGKGLFRRVNTVSLPDSKATMSNIQMEVVRAAKTVQPGDTFVLYLAGHGIAKDGEYYFIPWDAEYTNEKDLLAKSLNREKIQALLKQIPTNKSVLILDTCGAGAYLESRATALSEKAAIERVAVMSGRAVLAASNSDQMAMEGYQNHGVFTYALLEGLQRADGTAEGEILISRLAEYVQRRVPILTLERWKYRQSPLSRIDGEPFPIARKDVH